MTNALVLIALSASSVGLFVVFVRIPRWCTRSVHRHRIWSLRDRAVDAVLDERLPAHHPAVRRLVRELDGAAKNCGELNMLGMLVYVYTLRSNPEASRLRRIARASHQSHRGLTHEQSEMIRQYEKDLMYLLTGTILLGSWLGLAIVGWCLPRAARDAVRERRAGNQAPRVRDTLEADLWLTGGRATDLAIQTRLGHRVELIAREKRELLAVA